MIPLYLDVSVFVYSLHLYLIVNFYLCCDYALLAAILASRAYDTSHHVVSKAIQTTMCHVPFVDLLVL